MLNTIVPFSPQSAPPKPSALKMVKDEPPSTGIFRNSRASESW
jgi:hypothetical protein